MQLSHEEPPSSGNSESPKEEVVHPAITVSSSSEGAIPAPNRNAMQRSSGIDTVIIIGAGAAGLTAGYDCFRSNIPFVILEASNRIGGRLCKDESLADFPIDLGGEWIHGSPKILKTVVDDPTVSFHFQTKKYFLSPYRIYTSNRKFREEFYWDGDYQRFVNYTWYDFFAEYIAKDIQGSIQYGCAVETINYCGSRVTVSCQNGRVFEGSQAIVTVSIPLLRQLQFDPPLPAPKQTALEKIPFEPGLKAFFKFSYSFYYRGCSVRGREHGEIFIWDESHLQETEDCILGVFVYGGVAKPLVVLSDEEIQNHFLNLLDEMYNGLASEYFESALVCNWAKDANVQGLYSSYRNGIRYLFELARPVSDKLFFAGEAAPADGSGYGYAHGAALSGRKAVNDVKRVRNNLPIRMGVLPYFVHVLGLVCCGLEQKLFFNDDD